MKHLIFIFVCFFGIASSTDVNICPGKPSPDFVRIEGCDKPPCPVVKGKAIIFELDFIAGFHVKNLYTNVRATVAGITVNYPLPEEQKYACNMLLHGSYCPIYRGEDVTYEFAFEVATFYPEIGLTIEISLKDDYDETMTCFKVDIQVVKGP